MIIGTEQRGEFHVDIPSKPMTVDEIYQDNRRRFWRSLSERHGEVVGTLIYFLRGRKRLRELSEEVVMRAIRVEDNEYFRKYGRSRIPFI